MTDAKLLKALSTKRAEIAASIADLERQLAARRATLGQIDATIRLFAPELHPGEIKPKRARTESGHFALGEITRRCQDALRDATTPVTLDAIVTKALADKGLGEGARADFRRRFNWALLHMQRAGTVRRDGRDGWIMREQLR